MREIFLTIVVPVYKVNYIQLHRCIDSLIHQEKSKKFYEVLLIDDGSPDACGEICDDYSKKYSFIHVIHQENQGLSVVRNNGVDLAKGEWVAFVDGDDWLEPNFVKNAVEQVGKSKPETDILIWDGIAEANEYSTEIKFLDIDDTQVQEFSGKYKELLIDRIIPRHVSKSDIKRCTDIGVTWSRIYRKELLKKNKIVNIPNLRVMQDSIFNLWAFEYAKIITYQFKPIYHYSLYDTSISNKYDRNITSTMKELYGYFADYIRKCHNTEEYWQRLYNRTVRMLVKCLFKFYANPLNEDSMFERKRQMANDLSAVEFQTALERCDMRGQDFKFNFILFLLKHKFYILSILCSSIFVKFRRYL